MIHGIGVDIAAISRFQGFLDNHSEKLLDRLFSPSELKTCRKRKETASCLAARFAAKEAFMKALGTGLRDGISWHDVETISNALGKPEFVITGKALELCRMANISRFFLSLSHDGGNAVAMVVLESE